jgi:hypothetical protein
MFIFSYRLRNGSPLNLRVPTQAFVLFFTCYFFTEYPALMILLLWAGSDTEYEDENQKSLKASKVSRRQELDPKLRYLYGITSVRFVP